jgi:hypothetical protein
MALLPEQAAALDPLGGAHTTVPAFGGQRSRTHAPSLQYLKSAARPLSLVLWKWRCHASNSAEPFSA